MKPDRRDDEKCRSELARDCHNPMRGYSSLRLGRWSGEGCNYFVTFCTLHRATSLAVPEIINACAVQRQAMESDRAWMVRAWMIMPDHVHLLFELGSRLALGRAMARFKSKTSASLRSLGLAWQPGYFEHRLRSPEELRPILYYLLMNPVVAGLGGRGENWPGFYCCAQDWSWFGGYAREAVLQPAWLSNVHQVASKLAPTVPRNPSA